jgi:hypothetical protein
MSDASLFAAAPSESAWIFTTCSPKKISRLFSKNSPQLPTSNASLLAAAHAGPARMLANCSFLQRELSGKFRPDCTLRQVNSVGIAPLQEGVEVKLGHDLVKRSICRKVVRGAMGLSPSSSPSKSLGLERARETAPTQAAQCIIDTGQGG